MRIDLTLIFSILSIIAGLLTIAGGCLWIYAVHTFTTIVLSLYLILFGLYIVVSEVFMPSKLQVWMAFYLRWLGKALFFVFIGVLLLLPFQSRVVNWGYFLAAAIYVLILAAILLIIQILSWVNVHKYSTSHPIIFRDDNSSSTTISVTQRPLVSSESL